MDKMIYWIWLSLCCTPDSSTFSRLLESFDNAEEIWNASEKEIRASIGGKSADYALLINKDLERAEQIYKFCKSKCIGLLAYDDDEFPESLRDIPKPPVLLYYRGKLPNFSKTFRCSIVGTRSLSSYGRSNTFKIAYDLGCANTIVVSGMAVGIDGVALAGALASGASTIAVLGSGIDVCYPSQHLRLAREIVKTGCVFTEYAPGTKPDKLNFPRRNRIISGLSSATLVMEGRERSGAIITAHHAFAQGRNVYAFPGSVESPNSEVANLLLKNGAKICTRAEDILNDFEPFFKGIINPFKLVDKPHVNMTDVLREYEVSAVTSSDDIFNPPSVKRKIEQQPTEERPSISDETNVVPTLPVFDKDLLRLYKQIPLNDVCSIESLTDSENDMRKVMKMLLKLEMSRFVSILPGEKVKRNLK